MRFALIFVLLVSILSDAQAQFESTFHAAAFKKKSALGASRSRHYQPSDWEKPLFDKSEKAIFPTDVKAHPDEFSNKLILWIGIVREVSVTPNGDSSKVSILLDQKYWDFIEDYGVQDEVMYVSPKGDGQFRIVIPSIKLTSTDIEALDKMANEHKLMFCYGSVSEAGEAPVLSVRGIKMIDYAQYTTNIFSYDVKRDDKGKVEINPKNGEIKWDHFEVIRYARRGQNK